jgi:hypothetical protein
MLETLEGYAARGLFPRNHEVPDRRVPIFVDEAGRRCAMAHLIEVSGGGDLVARISATANRARIHELAGVPELRQWLERAGMTLEEAALIQPEYGYQQIVEEEKPREEVMTAGTFVAVGFGVPAVALNLRTDQPWSRRQQNAAFGLLTGASLLALGLTDALYDDELRGTGYIHLTVGGVASVLSIMNLARGPNEKPADAESSGGSAFDGDAFEQARGAAVAAAPPRSSTRVVVRSGTEGEPQLGLHVTF